ncbi:transposable element Tcb1 transposase [Trichonephila clavipes]|nr:transposable element Tcb1 transposase [Trichonephila clavipes]
MRRQLRVQRPPIHSISDLRDRCLNMWYNLSPAIYQGLVASMPRRVEAVLRAKEAGHPATRPGSEETQEESIRTGPESVVANAAALAWERKTKLTPPGRGNNCDVNGLVHPNDTQSSSRVGRNQTTIMWICDHWKQKSTTDRRDRSHPPQCTTSREDRQIVRMAAMDRSVTSRTIAQQIESVTHHSVSARTIRRRL